MAAAGIWWRWVQGCNSARRSQTPLLSLVASSPEAVRQLTIEPVVVTAGDGLQHPLCSRFQTRLTADVKHSQSLC
jgi:hypothetical protein